MEHQHLLVGHHSATDHSEYVELRLQGVKQFLMLQAPLGILDPPVFSIKQLFGGEWAADSTGSLVLEHLQSSQYIHSDPHQSPEAAESFALNEITNSALDFSGSQIVGFLVAGLQLLVTVFWYFSGFISVIQRWTILQPVQAISPQTAHL